MTKQDFLKELEDLLQRDEVCSENDLLEKYEEWDSLSKMSLIAFFNKHFNIKLTMQSFKNINKVSDLIALSNGNIK